MEEQEQEKSETVRIYWRKRHTVEKMINNHCSLQVGTDYTILSPERRNIDQYTGIIITLKGSNAVINKTRVENIFNFKDIKAAVVNAEKSFILDLKDIPQSKDEFIIPVVKSNHEKTDIAIKFQQSDALNVIIKLHSVKKIIGVSESSKASNAQIAFNYFNNYETNLANEFFSALGFSLTRPNKDQCKLLFILELPDDISYEKDSNIKSIERKFSFNDDEIIKLIEWECLNRFSIKLKTVGRINEGRELSTRFAPISSIRVQDIEKSLKFLRETYQIESVQDKDEPQTFYIKTKQNKQLINQKEKMNNQEEKNSKRRFNNIYRIAEEQNIKVYVNKDTTEMDVPKLKVIQLNGRKPTIRFIYGSGEEKKIFAKKLFKALEEANIPCSLSDKESSIVLDDTLTVKSVAVTKKTYTKGVKKVDLSELGQSLKDFIVMLSPEQRDFLFPQKPIPVSEINPSAIVDKISQNFYFISKKNKAAKLFEATPGFFENNESVLKKIKK